MRGHILVRGCDVINAIFLALSLIGPSAEQGDAAADVRGGVRQLWPSEGLDASLRPQVALQHQAAARRAGVVGGRGGCLAASPLSAR